MLPDGGKNLVPYDFDVAPEAIKRNTSEVHLSDVPLVTEYFVLVQDLLDNLLRTPYIPFSRLQSMTELFRRRAIKLLVGRELLNEDFARNLLSWKHSGFSPDAWASNEHGRVPQAKPRNVTCE